MTTRKKREELRLKAEGKVFQPKRLPPIPAPRVEGLKNKKKLEDVSRREAEEYLGR